jgi:hypothetical protein
VTLGFHAPAADAPDPRQRHPERAAQQDHHRPRRPRLHHGRLLG